MAFRRHKKLVIFLFMVLMAAFAGVAGFMLAESEPRIVAKQPGEESALPAGADDAQTSQDTLITWIYAYEMCAHNITVTQKAGSQLAGLSFTGMQGRYPDARIISFGADEVVLKKSFACYCPEHYILKKSGDRLAVFRTEPGKDTQSVYINVAVEFDSLPEETQQELAIGRVFATFEDLEAYLSGLSG